MWEWETEKHSDATWQGNNISTACVKWSGVNVDNYILVPIYMYGVSQIIMRMKGVFKQWQQFKWKQHMEKIKTFPKNQNKE